MHQEIKQDIPEHILLQRLIGSAVLYDGTETYIKRAFVENDKSLYLWRRYDNVKLQLENFSEIVNVRDSKLMFYKSDDNDDLETFTERCYSINSDYRFHEMSKNIVFPDYVELRKKLIDSVYTKTLKADYDPEYAKFLRQENNVELNIINEHIKIAKLKITNFIKQYDIVYEDMNTSIINVYLDEINEKIDIDVNSTINPKLTFEFNKIRLDIAFGIYIKINNPNFKFRHKYDKSDDITYKELLEKWDKLNGKSV